MRTLISNFSNSLVVSLWLMLVGAWAPAPVQAAAREALMVVGTVSIPDLNASDAAIQAKLEALGFVVTVVQAPASTTAQANGKALVLISSTVASGDVANKFRGAVVPVINWEQAVQDDFAMTGN